jgi:accessory colonization factor AcfC
MSNAEGTNIVETAEEAEELYVWLQRWEHELPEVLRAVRDRLQDALYRRMSIAEMEQLEQRVTNRS